MALTDQDKQQRYDTVIPQILAVLDGEENQTARMATISCLLSEAFVESYYWTGFYCQDPLKDSELVVGPYQGTLGCLRIAFGRGVCGLAAAEARTQIVDDVHAHPNHIACDARSASEIVVPVMDKYGQLIAVFDVDSTDKGSFNQVDQKALEGLMQVVFQN